MGGKACFKARTEQILKVSRNFGLLLAGERSEHKHLHVAVTTKGKYVEITLGGHYTTAMKYWKLSLGRFLIVKIFSRALSSDMAALQGCSWFGVQGLECTGKCFLLTIISGFLHVSHVIKPRFGRKNANMEARGIRFGFCCTFHYTCLQLA